MNPPRLFFHIREMNTDTNEKEQKGGEKAMMIFAMTVVGWICAMTLV